MVQALTYQWSFCVPELLYRNFEQLFLSIRVQVVCSTLYLILYYLVQSDYEGRSFRHCSRHLVVLQVHPEILETKILLGMSAKF